MPEMQTVAGQIHRPRIRALNRAEAASRSLCTVAVREPPSGRIRQVLTNVAQPAHDLFVREVHPRGAAHRSKVLHCDLKPENVVVAEGGHVMLVDFGLARSALRRLEVETPGISDRRLSAPASASAAPNEG